MKLFFKRVCANEWTQFIAKVFFYCFVLIFLIYLYHYKTIQGGNFIYNEF
ncbi:MAG: teichoic acid D-Ala incorporation-associated protein DltX [Enterococcus sp.]